MKIKVLLDTNIILSSMSEHSSAVLLKHATNDFEFYITSIINEEVEKVIRESKQTRDSIIGINGINGILC